MNKQLTTITKTTKQLTRPQKKKRKARSRTQSRLYGQVPFSVRPNGVQSKVFQDYLNTLNDPFEYGPVRLGWGTMVNSSLVSAYVRGYTNTGAGGHVSIQAYPGLGSGYPYTWSIATGLTSSIWSTTEANLVPANQSTIATNFRELRVVSCGIRVKSLAPQTSAEPFGYAGINNGGPIGDVQGAVIDVLWKGLNATPLYDDARAGLMVTGRPIDVDSFSFGVGIVGQTTTATFSHPWISVLQPTTTAVAYEVIYHFEALSANAGAFGQSNMQEPSFLDSLASLFASPDHLLATVHNLLKPAAGSASFGSLAARALGATLTYGLHVGRRDQPGGGYIMA